MRSKSLLLAAAFALTSSSAQAQFLGETTVVTSGPGVVVGSPTVLAPAYAPAVVSPYSVVTPAPVVVRRRTVVAPTVYGAPVVYGSSVVPGPVLMSPGVTVVRPGWGRGYGFGYGPRPWGRRGW